MVCDEELDGEWGDGGKWNGEEWNREWDRSRDIHRPEVVMGIEIIRNGLYITWNRTE